MSMELDFLVHLLIAGAGSWLIVLGIRKVLEAVNKATAGKFYALPWVRTAGEALDVLLPLLPCIPAGLLFMAWPTNAVLDEPLYQFLAGAIGGSVSSQLYQLIVRALRRRAARLLRNSNGGSSAPPADAR